MDGPKIQAKLSRTHSSLLRSSPTVGSPFESLSSVREFAPDQETEDLEEQKPHNRPCTPRVRASASRFALALSVLLLSVYTFFLLLIWDDISTSEDLLLSLIFVAGLLFFVSKNKVLIIRTLRFCKNFVDEHGKRLGLSRFTSNTHSKPVQWFIGESNTYKIEREQQIISFKKIVREGVEFYSNGDFYEGEFHKGRCNGSGVYNYIVNGRYEGDWVDGKYDGYGIESWARGSRYKGQYRQGLRHGYGVYKFYTGDTYAGEWCNGQSHGIGVQTCGDGSCYSGEFKFGVKHGLGCYNFRNGDTYAGEYFGDRIHGFGVYHFGNGHCYEGSWHEGRKQGYGMYTFRNVETRCGEWDGGKLKTSVSPLTGPVLKSVQAARKVAEKAIHLCQVEEKVNKALTAADRAAAAARVAAVRAVQNRIHGKFCNTNDENCLVCGLSG